CNWIETCPTWRLAPRARLFGTHCVSYEKWFPQREPVTCLSRCYSESLNPTSKSLVRVGETISHMRRNVSQTIALAELVAMSGMSRSNYIRMFEAAMGTSPINYLIGLRIDEASRLLRSTDRSITDIAFDVGFSDSNYFSRQFRKAHDQSPREYRKLYR
ncbi:MAG: AraC family transcriptional regulator, partial [Planctomycetota bacterium]